jgi:hypothetical protein
VDSLPGAVSLARALLSLSRARQTGVLHVATEIGGCWLVIVDGVPRAASALPGRDDTLGDALVREGALDPHAHHEALRRSERTYGPVGHWLVDAGLVGRPALELALRRQLRDRVLHVFACQTLDYRFELRAPAPDAPLIEEPVGTADLVLAAMRAQVATWTRERLLAAVEPGELRATALGTMLAREAALWPEEAAVTALLAQGTTLERVLQLTGGAPRALRLLAAMSLLSAVAARPTREQRFSLLVRKREQLRHCASPRALLDLPNDAAPAEARRALRRLASRLHPDAFGPHATDAVRRASSEVLGALIDAEHELRTEAPLPMRVRSHQAH